MIISINQPAYLPWLGYFDRIEASDIHVVLDHVQYEKNSAINRNQIRSKEGKFWLTIPVSTKGKFGYLPINQVEISDKGRFITKHLSSIRNSYSRSRMSDAYFQDFERIYSSSFGNPYLLPFINVVTEYQLSALEIDTKIIMSSSLNLKQSKSDLILEICQALNASEYLSGPFGRQYLNLLSFQQAGIKVTYHEYIPQPYQQCWPDFISHLSAVDALMSLEKHKVMEVMKLGRILSEK